MNVISALIKEILERSIALCPVKIIVRRQSIEEEGGSYETPNLPVP